MSGAGEAPASFCWFFPAAAAGSSFFLFFSPFFFFAGEGVDARLGSGSEPERRQKGIGRSFSFREATSHESGSIRTQEAEAIEQLGDFTVGLPEPLRSAQPL